MQWSFSAMWIPPKLVVMSLGDGLAGSMWKRGFVPPHPTWLHREEMEPFLSSLCDSLEAGLG